LIFYLNLKKNFTLKEYLVIYKPFLLFLTKFFVSYLVLTFVYQSYLNQFEAKKFEVDGFTKFVAHQTEGLLHLFKANAKTEASKIEPAMNFYYNNKFLSRIIEGCNALSVMILFVAFVVAFTGTIKHTVLYCLGGCLLIHIMNIARIALLNVATYHFKTYEVLLHDIVFPLFIYGVVFVLWVVWVNKFSVYAKKHV
jgi:exosortase family protein XrtF